MKIRFPYSKQNVTSVDLQSILKAASEPLITQGQNLAQFEKSLCSKFSAEHAVVCNSGTAALHLLYLALGLGPDAGLVTTPITFLATANAARMCNAPVVFADVDPITGLITPETLEAALQETTTQIKVAAIVHLGGRCADMPRLAAVAEKHGVLLVEDACHAIGARYCDNNTLHPIGSCAHSVASTFSFHPVKHITMGEGGAVLTNCKKLTEKMQTLRSHGVVRDPDSWSARPENAAPWYYEMHHLGWNYRADEISCALGLSQLGRLDVGLARRRALTALYHEELTGLDFLRLPTPPLEGESHAWHLYAVAIDFERLGKSRGTVMVELSNQGIGSQVHYIPLTEQPYYKRDLNTKTPPGANQFYKNTLSIPLYPELEHEDVLFISKVLKTCVQT